MAEPAVLLMLSKKTQAIWGNNEEDYPLETKQMAVKLIEQAVAQGACCYEACDVMGISWRTYRRWVQTGVPLQDKRLKGGQKKSATSCSNRS